MPGKYDPDVFRGERDDVVLEGNIISISATKQEERRELQHWLCVLYVRVVQ